MDTTQIDDADLLDLTAKIVSAHVSNNTISVADMPGLIVGVHGALAAIRTPKPAADDPANLLPAVPVRSSIKPDYLVCLEDGKKLKMLKRHLATAYSMTPDEYRRKWGLSATYPMVAPNYAETRRQLAKRIGLGTQRTRLAKAA